MIIPTIHNRNTTVQFPRTIYAEMEPNPVAMKFVLASKSESYEICLIPDNDYRGFLKRKVDGLEEQVDGGDFVLTDGTIIGKHKGYPFYTVGQRKGLEIAMGEPRFVTKIIPETNIVVLRTKKELEQQVMWVRNYNLIKYASFPTDKEILIKIRYKIAGTMSSVKEENRKLKVLFHNKFSAIAPGQSAVFYEGNDLIDGGYIV